MYITNKNSNSKLTILAILAITTALVFLIQIALVDNAQALTRYFNCVTKDANNHGTLSLADAEKCYTDVFHGARNADDDGRPLSASTNSNSSFSQNTTTSE